MSVEDFIIVLETSYAMQNAGFIFHRQLIKND